MPLQANLFLEPHTDFRRLITYTLVSSTCNVLALGGVRPTFESEYSPGNSGRRFVGPNPFRSSHRWSSTDTPSFSER